MVGIRAITKTITIIITKATVDMVAMAVMAMITTITTTKVAMATGVIMDRIMDMDMVS